MSKCIIDSDGNKNWCKDGRLHREDGPAYIGANGTVKWWENGKLHRSDGPAIEYAHGTLEWWSHGHLHRLDGPAIDCQYGNGYWFINNISLPIRDVNTWMEEQNITWPFDEPTQMLFLMKFG